MKIIKDLKDIERDKKTVITLGTFDGLHLGHQQIVETLIKKSKQSNARNFLITFDPHPRKVIPGRNDVKLLSTLEEKTSIFEKLGLENLFVVKFTSEFYNKLPNSLLKNILLMELVCRK